jgi:hypothetical protein
MPQGSRGRPPRVPGTPSTNRVVFTLTDAELEALKRFAGEDHLSTADLVRVAVMDYVNDPLDDVPVLALRLTRTP